MEALIVAIVCAICGIAGIHLLIYFLKRETKEVREARTRLEVYFDVRIPNRIEMGDCWADWNNGLVCTCGGGHPALLCGKRHHQSRAGFLRRLSVLRFGEPLVVQRHDLPPLEGNCYSRAQRR